MKRILSLFILWLSFTSAFGQSIKYRGKIDGKQEIDLELTSSDDRHYTGRYQQKGDSVWFSLSGIAGGETQSNLELKVQDSTGKQTAAFDLVFDGDALNGTWTSVADPKPLDVLLQLRDEEVEAIRQNKEYEMADGYYYCKENELRVKSAGSNYEVAIWINSNSGCEGILLTGKVSSGSAMGWKGKLVDDYGHGDANVTIRFEGNLAYVTVDPLFKPGLGCLLKVPPYERGKKRQDAELD